MVKKKKKKLKAKDRKLKNVESKGISIKPEAMLSILQVFFWAMAGLILVSFARQGSILIKVNDFLTDYFGWTTVFLPFIFLSLGFLISKFKFVLGQPNVAIGIILFFVSFTSLMRSGQFGKSAWDGVSVLVTPAGAFLVLLGTTVVGLIILFNTSLDQFFLFLGGLLMSIRSILTGEKKKDIKPLIAKPDFGARREIKVLGGNSFESEDDSKDKESDHSELRQGLSEGMNKPISNNPGEDQIWKYPPTSLLTNNEAGKADRGDIKGNAATIEQTLESFGITARVVEVNLGPAVTQYALEVALGTKLSKITGLERDLALMLAAPGGTIRIEAPIPGRSLVGIELPNKSPEFVPMKKMLLAKELKDNESKLAVALGLDVAGKPVVGNIAKMPHVLIAGQTGSGKSVALNTFLASILFRASPAEVKLIMVDPKRVELTGYNNIPHLLAPVIVEPEKVISALRWLLTEMDRRYKLFAEAGVRNIDSFNQMSGFQALPYIVLVIDELADIMLFAPVEVEDSITRIAQMSRATGIHMVLATQRPSVDVITGLIKANIPCRIAFAVSSQIDSRVILDTQGAEKLLGKGDMLYLSPDQAKARRIQGAYVSDGEIHALVDYIKGQGVEPHYTEEVTAMPKGGASAVPGVDGDTDDLFKQAVEVVCQHDKASASLLQRRLSVGYARAARIIDQLEAAGVVSPPDGSKPREVLIKSPSEIFGS